MVAPDEPEIKGIIETIAVSAGGSGYTAGAVTIAGAGSEATATATVDASGVITAINVTNGGSGYDNTATVSAAGGTGLSATVSTTSKDAVPAVFNEMQLEVPILTMLPIPFIRVEEGEIDFHAKITSMEYANVGSKF